MESPVTQSSPPRLSKRRLRWTWIVGVAVALLYCASAFFYNRTLPADLGAASVQPPSNGVAVYFIMKEVQLTSDRISADVLFSFGDELLECNPVCGLKEDLLMLFSPATQPKIQLPSGTPSGYTTPFVLFLEGAPYTYPFDTYLSRVFIQAIGVSSDGSSYAVPVVNEMLVPEGFVGWQIQLDYPRAGSDVDPAIFLTEDVSDEDTSPSPNVNSNGETWAMMHLQRAFSTKIISLIVLGLMVLLAGLSVTSSLDVQVGRIKDVTFGMAGWLTGLLFAMPALRALLPGSPPLGSWIDILVFFWVEIATMISLATFVLYWVRRSPLRVAESQKAEKSEKDAESEKAQETGDGKGSSKEQVPAKGSET